MNRIFSLLVGMTLLFTATHTLVMAEEGGDTSSKQREVEAVQAQKAAAAAEKLKKLCERYSTSQLGKNTSEKRNEFNSKLTARGTELSEKRGDWDSKRLEARVLADSKRQTHYDSLLAKAITDEQKQAVMDFKTAVEQAVANRRLAQDNARDAYRASVDSAMTERKSSFEAAASSFDQAVASALSRAKESCESGVANDVVKANLNAELKTARDTLANSKTANGATEDSIKQLLEIRKAAVENAKTAFDAAMEQAKLTLESALAADDL